MFLNDCYCHLSLTFTVKILICLPKIEKETKKAVKVFFFPVSTEEGSEMRYSREEHEFTAAPHSSVVCPAFPPLPSGWLQRAGSPNRRLPLSDYNLWSISIIGGVCRDSYSNNYLDWSVSKATNITPFPFTQTVTLHRTVLKPAWSQLRNHWLLALKRLLLKTCLFKITESSLYSALIPQ